MRGKWLAPTAIVTVIGLQFAVPAVAFVQEPPTRLGFQMYSGYGDGDITALDADGRLIELDWPNLLARNLRPELDWTRVVPQYLCSHVHGIDKVVVERESGARTVLACG